MLLQELLERADVDYKQKDDEISICCPFCPTHDDRMLLGINVENGLAHCFHCGWSSGGVIETAKALAEVYGISFRIHFEAKKDEKEYVPKPVPTEPVVISRLPVEYERFVGDTSDKVEKRIRGYLKSRGVSHLQIERHQIGFAACGRYAWRAIFPVLGEDGKCYGFVARSIDVRQQPKYLNSPGIKLLWGAHQAAKTAVIVEGVLDALRVEHALMRRRDWIAVARLGSTMTGSQFRQLRKYERLILLPDRDAAGVKGAVAVAELCAANHIQVEMAIPQEMDGRDPGDMTEDEVNDYIDSAQQWTQATYYRMKTAAAK